MDEQIENQAEGLDVNPEQTQDEPKVEDKAEEQFAQGFNEATGVEEPKPEPSREDQDQELADRLGIRALAEDLKKLRSSNDKVSGLAGSLKQQIEEFKSRVNTPQGVDINDEDFAELKHEYPEFAETLLPGLSRILSRRTPNRDEAPRVQGLSSEQKSMQDELTMRHADWREVTNSDDYRGWVQSLPPDQQEVANNSWSVAAASAVLDAYKASKSPKSGNQNRQERLEAAVTPRGKQTTPAQTNEDAFTAGFKAVRAGRL